jgi:two-component system cell cycle response regulator
MGSIKKNKTLIFDTDILLANELSQRLANVGFDVLAANDVDNALKLIEVVTPSIILLDPSMKAPDGKEFLPLLKSKGALINTPLIILSQNTSSNAQVSAFLQGASDYIIKPFQFNEVLARINNQLRIYSLLKNLEEKNMALSKRNVILEQMAITDSLTELYNKGYILRRLESELTRSARYNEPISLILLDIDFFKKINDTLGHIAGDTILKRLSKKLKESVRDVDVVARYGGEEFLVVCPNTSISGAAILAERIRESVQNTLFQAGNIDVKLTVSLGISHLSPSSLAVGDFSSSKLLQEADSALYKAKSAGRNKVAVFTKELGTICIEDNKKYKHLFTTPVDTKNKFTH